MGKYPTQQFSVKQFSFNAPLGPFSKRVNVSLCILYNNNVPSPWIFFLHLLPSASLSHSLPPRSHDQLVRWPVLANDIYWCDLRHVTGDTTNIYTPHPPLKKYAKFRENCIYFYWRQLQECKKIPNFKNLFKIFFCKYHNILKVRCNAQI